MIRFDPTCRYRISFCAEAKRNVLQLFIPETNEWLCLHEDTVEEEQEVMRKFLQKYRNQLHLENYLCGLYDLELVQGHLINPEMGVNITLYPTQPGDRINPVLIEQDTL